MTDAGRKPPLVVHVIYSLDTGGLENGLVNLINHTPPGRYRHAIVCLTRSGAFARRITAPDVEIHELDKRPGHDLKVYYRLWRVLARLRPAIIHTRNLTTLELQLVAILIPGARRIHGEHGRDIQDLEGTSKKYNRLRKLIRPLVHRYIAVSEDLARWLEATIDVPRDKIRQIYGGVCQESFYPAGGPRGNPFPDVPGLDGSFVIGTVGRLAAVKNQVFLVNAFAALCRSDPALRENLFLLLVGDGSLRAELEERIAELGVGDRVLITGTRDDIPDLLRLMDVFVLPSLNEGISNTLLEAMATGLPVVATAVGGNPELVENGANGLLVPVGDEKALAAALHRLYLDADLRRSMGEDSLRRIRRTFNWPRAVADYLAVYDEVLAPSGRRAINQG